MDACPQCRSRDLVVLVLEPYGEPLHFASCRRCEHRTWLRAGGADLSLPEVLAGISAA